MKPALISGGSLAAVLIFASVGAPSGPELTALGRQRLEALIEAKRNRTETEKRIDSALLAAMKMQRGEPVAAGVEALPGVWNRVKLDVGGRTLVDLRAEVTEELLESLARLGAKVESSHPAYQAIRAHVPLLLMKTVAELPGVERVDLAAAYMTNTGPNNSQGDAAHRAATVRGMGITGAGVKVGVMSDGVDALAARQAAGDLPAAVTVLAPGAGNEGTAMLEIVHDIAPGALLHYATGVGGPPVMASNIIALANAGCRVIVDDLTYFSEGAFQDGVIAQAVNTVTAQGVLYYSSAANSGNKNDNTSGTWEGDFVEGGNIQGIPVHTFEGSTSNLITANTGPISLKWSDPLGASANDYDLYIFDNALTAPIDGSEGFQDGNDDPFEIVDVQASGSRVVVTRFGATTQPRALRVDTNRGRLSINTAGNTYGHNAGASTISVAATDARVTAGGPFVGGATNPVETFSSDGPRRLFFNPDGSAITPGNLLFGTNGGVVLQKPDITAGDCVTTGTPGFATFCGTSAAAPHAAAIAALALSSPSAPGTGVVKAIMAATALDIEAAGIDRDSGVGIVMADRTIAGLAPPVAGTAKFITLAPCRLADTRNPISNAGGPALIALNSRAFLAAGTCSVPTGAKALSLNVTITGPTAPGNLRIFPVGVAAPIVSAINFYPGQTRANNAVVQVGGGTLAGIVVQNDSPAPVHFILDVNGYFQ